MEDDLAKIAKNFEDEVSANRQDFVDHYIERFGRCIDTDNARELCLAYANNYYNRAFLAPLIHESASQIAKAVWHTLLDRASGEPGVVIFVAGGPGSGKSTVCKTQQFQECFQEAIVVYDSTFSTYSSAREKIQDALDAGKDIDIYYVHRNAKEAAYSVIERAVKTGRTVPIQEVSNLHWGAQRTILHLCDDYRDSDNINIHLFNNQRKLENSENPKSDDWVDWFENEEDLQNVQYSSIMEVERLVNSGAKEAYDNIIQNQGSFPTAIAQGIFGREFPF